MKDQCWCSEQVGVLGTKQEWAKLSEATTLEQLSEADYSMTGTPEATS